MAKIPRLQIIPPPPLFIKLRKGFFRVALQELLGDRWNYLLWYWYLPLLTHTLIFSVFVHSFFKWSGRHHQRVLALCALLTRVILKGPTLQKLVRLCRDWVPVLDQLEKLFITVSVCIYKLRCVHWPSSTVTWWPCMIDSRTLHSSYYVPRSESNGKIAVPFFFYQSGLWCFLEILELLHTGHSGQFLIEKCRAWVSSTPAYTYVW